MKMLTKIRSGTIAMFTVIIFAYLTPIVFAQTPPTPSPDFTIAYSFDEFNAIMQRVKVYDKSGTLLNTMNTGVNSFSLKGVGSFQIYTSNAFMTDTYGSPISEDDAMSYSKLLRDLYINGTWITYREYYYCVDVLLFSDVLLPPTPTTVDMSMGGWTSASDCDAYNKRTVSIDNKFLLVAEEVAPSESYDNPSTAMYTTASFTGQQQYRVNSWGFIPGTYYYFLDPTPKTYLTSYTSFFEDLSYKTKSIDQDAMFNAVGGKEPMTVIPEITLKIIPNLDPTRTININGSQVGIYTAITSATTVKNDIGIVQDAYASTATDYSNEINKDITVKESITSTDEPAPTSNTVPLMSYTATCVVDSVYSQVPITSRQEGVGKGIPLAMYISNTSTAIANVGSDLRLIKGAPNEIMIKPTLKIQPNWLLESKKVTGNGLWISYYDPWQGYEYGKFGAKSWSYTDLPDQTKTLTTSITPLIKVTCENTFVKNRFKFNVLVATVADKPIVLSGSGNSLEDPKLGGNNNWQIDDPLNSSSTYVTPPERKTKSIFDTLADWWNDVIVNPLGDWWKNLTGLEIDPTIVTFIIIAIIAVVIVVVLVTILKSVSGRKKKQQVLAPQYYAQQTPSPQSTAPTPSRPQETHTPPSSPSSGTTSSPFNDGRKRDSARNGNVVDRYRRKTS